MIALQVPASRTHTAVEALISRSRQEAVAVQRRGPNHYASSVLGELETRLERRSAVYGGRRETRSDSDEPRDAIRAEAGPRKTLVWRLP